MNTAYFLKHPRTIEDVRIPHRVDWERPYEIVADVQLSALDYENFITDMLVDRRFIEERGGLCAEGMPMRCLFVRRRGRADGVLLVPERVSFVKWAAYATEKQGL